MTALLLILIVMAGIALRFWPWFSGAELDGKPRTNATWTRRADRVLHPSGRAIRWHHWPRWWRAGIRTGIIYGPFLVFYDLTVFPTATIIVLAAGSIVGLGLAVWHLADKALAWQHNRKHVRPVRRAVTYELGVPPPKLEIPRNLDNIVVGTGDRVLNEKEQQALEYVVTGRLGITAEATWRQHSTSPHVIFRKVTPCPSLIEWEAFEEECASAGRNELVVGMGKDGKVIKVSLTQDSPHFAVSMGSGGGKSVLVAFWLLQELRRGAIALILDAKWTSHPWVFKDMDAEYGQLPCVRYCRRTEDLHDAMVWLDGEVERRSQVADRIMNARGDLLAHRGSVGPRLWVIGEEMNLASDRLKEHWAQIRQKGDPARSPAFKGMGAVAQAGRSLDMHLVAVGQQLTAASVGGGAVRENLGVRCLGRYQLNTWKMLAGDLPMPPCVMTPGRLQCVVGPTVDEAQAPLMDLEQVRELVLDSDMTQVPDDMPGIATSVFRPSVLAGTVPSLVAPDQGFDLGNPGFPPAPSRPPGTVTLGEAVAGHLVEMKLETLQRRSTRPGFPEKQGWDGRAALYRISDLKNMAERNLR